MTGSGRFITAVLLLSSLGFFAVTAQAQDCSRPVGDNMDLKGNDIHQNSFPDGTTVTFECNIGYVSAGGSPSVTCAAGSWSPVRLKCERKNCGAVEEVDNGQIHYDPGTEFGDKAVLICNPGYRAVGRGDLICGDQGWLGRLPVCEVIKCESPPVVQDGSFSPNKDIYEYNEVIQYTCKKDYTLDGSRQLHCSDDTTFKPEPPRCIKVECGDPEIPFGQWSSGARPPYGYLSTVTLQCNAGYKMNGTATVTCGLNSQWSPGLPQCIPVECGDPEISFGQWHSGARPPYGYKSTVTLQCNTGYTMIGAATVMCELNSQWSPGLPQCILPFAEGCEDPKKRSAEVTVSSQPPYRHGVKVTLSCPPGYKLNGPDSQTCEKNGLWSPGIPLCTLDNGNGSSTGVVIGILVGVGAVLGIGFGGFMWHKKNGEKGKRTGRGNTDKDATKDEENVALS